MYNLILMQFSRGNVGESERRSSANTGQATVVPTLSATDPNCRKLIAKKPGTWIVDASEAHDSDSGDIKSALENAAVGDIITLRAGKYDEALNITKDVTVQAEQAAKGPVQINLDLKRTIRKRMKALR